jgi:hypothetical protein
MKFALNYSTFKIEATKLPDTELGLQFWSQIYRRMTKYVPCMKHSKERVFMNVCCMNTCALKKLESTNIGASRNTQQATGL